MAYVPFVTKPLQRGKLHVAVTQQFKTTVVVFHLRYPLRAETVTTQALLPAVMQRGTAAYPTTLDLRRQLEMMYGALLLAHASKEGAMQPLRVGMVIPQEAYLPDAPPLLAQSITFLGDLLLKPYLEEGVFSPSFVEAEKRNLQQAIESLRNDKPAYMNQLLMEKMFPNEPYALFGKGRLEDLPAITPGRLYEHYQQVLSQALVDCYVVGDVDIAQVQAQVEQVVAQLPAETPASPAASAPAPSRAHAEVQRFTEPMAIHQGRLHMGFRTQTEMCDPLYPALLFYNGLLGGFPHSKLFREVRERHSLAYSCSSSTSATKDVLVVQAGVDPGKVEKAEQIIGEQLQALQDGKISEEEWTQTRAMLVNRWLGVQDDPYGMIDFHYRATLQQADWTPLSLLEQLQRVELSAVREVAARVKLDTVYTLQPQKG